MMLSWHGVRWAWLLALALLGCARPCTMQLYSGARRVAASVAVIELYAPHWSPALLVDQVRVPRCGEEKLELELLPGPHELGVIDGLLPQAPPYQLRFTAEAGKRYYVLLRRAHLTDRLEAELYDVVD